MSDDKVAERAEFRGEHCPLAGNFINYSAQIDHIISLKQGGNNAIDNLACAYWLRNCNKWINVGLMKYSTPKFIPFFDLRIDVWSEHFQLVSYRIEAISSIGLVTEFIFGFNEGEQLTERSILF